ncbi:hypothetical protein F0P96_16425 [Hymenobacter busanensis]|uniref:Uncharacterized protein n=1 Tax=Hymenobacter busanensis TaxID=2607656 RepID=A0A7L4ZTH6_9BACT|nr:hypothetical protein [Hymenobacter busanensis]KAA9327566.1 hypothetical protein F0P96_16425 [Hymenobacter busanensis]QHJ06096.1 hypothetical protein GUY19_01810 [Hymenobacter busanensis]
MNRPTPTRSAFLYWLAAAACLLVVGADVVAGNGSKIVGSLALFGSFLLLAFFPNGASRPRWVGWVSMGLVLVALVSLAYRLARPTS